MEALHALDDLEGPGTSAFSSSDPLVYQLTGS
jgi:hypothetical protein